MIKEGLARTGAAGMAFRTFFWNRVKLNMGEKKKRLYRRTGK